MSRESAQNPSVKTTAAESAVATAAPRHPYSETRVMLSTRFDPTNMTFTRKATSGRSIALATLRNWSPYAVSARANTSTTSTVAPRPNSAP